jgi:hypothetical protein
MPQPERLLSTVRRAAAAFRATPGRRGHKVCPPDAAEVLVAGDLHGNVDNFAQLLKVADLGRQPRRHLVVQEVIHGKARYPDGGDKSHQLVDLIAALKCQYPDRVHLLPGNHELSQCTGRRIGKGADDLNDRFRQGITTAYGAHAAALFEAYVEMLLAAPLAVRTANRVLLTHSVPAGRQLVTFDPAVLEQDTFAEDQLKLGGSAHSLVWGRGATEEEVMVFLAKMEVDWVITGHIPQETGFAVPNRRQIILDAQGRPACYCLFPADRAVSQEDLVRLIGTLP